MRDCRQAFARLALDDLLNVGRALRRSARVARKTARMHGTPIYSRRNGKGEALKP
jgi:hypothetical protein